MNVVMKPYIFLWLILLIITNEFSPHVNCQEKYSPEELRSDLHFLFMTMEDVHPNLYAYTFRDEIQHKRMVIEESLTTPLSRIEFYKKIAPLVSSFNDGHTGITPPREEYDAYANDGGLVFPFDVDIIDKRLFIAINYIDEELIPTGSEILLINTYPAFEIVEKFIHYRSGERVPFRVEAIKRTFRLLLWVLYGFQDEFHIEFISTVTGDTLKKTVNGVSADTIVKMRETIFKESQVHYTYMSIPEVKTGAIDFRSFRDVKAFDVFLNETFKRIKDEEVKYLIIDIRNNGGGDARLGHMLLDYITDQPWSKYSRIEIKASRQIKELTRAQIPRFIRWLPTPLLPDLFWRRALSTPEGEMFDFPYELIREPKKNPLRFNGELYVLIGPYTFSSAADFASAIKDHRIGTLIGEETGGLATSFGDNYHFTLPHTQFHGTVSHRRFVRPSGEDDGYGVLPDIEVITDIDDVIEGRDPVMEYVLDLIRNTELEEHVNDAVE